MEFVMTKFKKGDFVIIKSTIGNTNEVVEINHTTPIMSGDTGEMIKLYCCSNNRAYPDYKLELWNPKHEAEGGYKMKLEAGKKYKTRIGKECTVTLNDDLEQFKLGYKFKCIVSNRLYSENGNYYIKTGESNYDLIEEVKMKEISINKKYKTRDGRPVEIIAIREGLLKPVVGIIKDKCTFNGYLTWYPDGLYHNETTYDYDLIEVSSYADFKIDDKVIVWNDSVGIKCRGYFAGVGISHGRPLIWDDGQTSWSTKSDYCYTTSYDNCVKWDGTDD